MEFLVVYRVSLIDIFLICHLFFFNFIWAAIEMQIAAYKNDLNIIFKLTISFSSLPGTILRLVEPLYCIFY